MRLSAKAGQGPPSGPRSKPSGAPPAGKAAATPLYYGEEEWAEEEWKPTPTPKGKVRPAPKPKAVSNGGWGASGDDDDDDGPRPPPGPPPKKAGAPKPKAKTAGAIRPNLTPMTPAPKPAARGFASASAWGADEGEEAGEEAEDDPMGTGDAGEEQGETEAWSAPPAKRFKGGGPAAGMNGGFQQSQGKGAWGNQGGGCGGGSPWGGGGGKAKGKGPPTQFKEGSMENVDGIMDGLLPIQQRLDEVIAAVCGPSPVCCIGGDTGSGKSTQVPQIIFKDACDKMQEVKIAVVQPRRVAAIALSKRVSNELGEGGPGGLVGYRIGGESKPGFAIDFCSTGYFLQLLVNAPAELGRYSHVILDEVHERSAESDLLCFVVRRLVSGPAKGIRIVVMSATVNMALFSNYFSRLVDTGEKPAEVFVGKKCYPVAEYFLDELLEGFPDLRCGMEIQQRLQDSFPQMGAKGGFKGGKQRKVRVDPRHCEKFNNLINDVLRVLGKGGTTIICFLPGIAEITAVWQEARLLQDGGHFEVMPLHSMIPQEEQQAVFADSDPRKCRVILATDIAESSLTLPNIACVIDFGLHRRMDHGDKRSLASLQTKWISKAAAKQRAGRSGRTQPGMCVRLYTEQWFQNVMEEFEPPETQCTPLDRLYLQAKQLCEKLGHTSKIQRSAKAALLELVQAPDVSKIEDARTELADMGAIDSPEESARITRFGQLCTQLPLDLRISRCVWLGVLFGAPCDGVILAAVLSTNDPFSWPAAHFAKSEEDYATWLRDTTTTRLLFDGGLQSEPLMLRQLFLEWLVTMHEQNFPWGNWGEILKVRRRQTEQFAKKYRLARGRMEHIVSQVLDLSLRTFHACSGGSIACKQLRKLICVLGYSINERGDLDAVSAQDEPEIRAALAGENCIFEDNTNILRGLLAATFSDFLLLGSYAGTEEVNNKGKGNQHNTKTSKAIQLELLNAVHDRKVNVHNTAWYGTQKDQPITGIERYMDHVFGRAGAKPQTVLEGKNICYVEFTPKPDPWMELKSKPNAGASIGPQFEFNLLNHHSSAMREVQRWKTSPVEWSFGVHTLTHPHEIKWELMQPAFNFNNQPVRSMAICERRNAVGFVTRTPVTDENFGMLRRVNVFAVASSVHGTENPGRIYPVGVTTLAASHIAFVLTTAKYSNSQWGSRFGITTDGSLSVMGHNVDLPDGLLTREWWDRIQTMRAAIRRELSNPLEEHDDAAALERATGGQAPLVLTDAEDVQEAMCALLEEAENFHGKEAVESLEESTQTADLVYYDPKDLPVAMQPLASWEDVEDPSKKATVRPKVTPGSSKGQFGQFGQFAAQAKAQAMQGKGLGGLANQVLQSKGIQPGKGSSIAAFGGKAAPQQKPPSAGMSAIPAWLSQSAKPAEEEDEDEKEEEEKEEKEENGEQEAAGADETPGELGQEAAEGGAEGGEAKDDEQMSPLQEEGEEQ